MDDEIKTVAGWIKHPPHEIEADENGRVQQPALVLTEYELLERVGGDPELFCALALKRGPFTNPVHAIEAIILAHDAELYPPLEVMDWLVSCLREWHEKGGRITMDAAMALKSPKGGQTANAMREAIKAQFKEELMIELNKLRFVFDLTIQEAAGMISARLDKNSNWNRTPFPLPSYQEGTLCDMYKKRKCRSWIPDNVVEKFRAFSDEEKREILARYPRHGYEGLPKMTRYL